MRLIDADELEKCYYNQIELGSDPHRAFDDALQDTWNTHDAMHSDYIQGVIRTAETLPEAECLAQLAEEASELAQAALKLRRALGTGNPTPISTDEAVANLTEEIADVQLCTAVICYADTRVNGFNIEKVMNEKAARWLKRLKERVANNG